MRGGVFTSQRKEWTMYAYRPVAGSRKEDIDTPALLLDRNRLRGNIETMATLIGGMPADLRPHCKTHKSVEIARMQMAAGAVGITCAKVGEAEALVDGGIGDVLISSPIVGPIKLERLTALARRCAVATVVDDVDNVRALSAAAGKARVKIRCLVEIDVGMGRCGVGSADAAVSLAREVYARPGLIFGGFQAYEGHLRNLLPLSERERRVAVDLRIALEAKELAEKAGMLVETITGGSTGTYMFTGRIPWMSEVQAGSYATMDVKYRSVGITAFSCALTVLTTVVSRVNKGRAVVDAGLKAVTPEFGPPDVLVPGARFGEFTEEQGEILLEGGAPELRVGDKIELIPSHGCTTINLYDYFHVLEDDHLVDVWPVSGRGRSQ